MSRYFGVPLEELVYRESCDVPSLVRGCAILICNQGKQICCCFELELYNFDRDWIHYTCAVFSLIISDINSLVGIMDSVCLCLSVGKLTSKVVDKLG